MVNHNNDVYVRNNSTNYSSKSDTNITMYNNSESNRLTRLSLKSIPNKQKKKKSQKIVKV